MKKRAVTVIVGVFLSVLVIGGILFGSAVYDIRHHHFDGNDYSSVSWKLDGDVATVTGNGEMIPFYEVWNFYVWEREQVNPFYSLAEHLYKEFPVRKIVIGKGITGLEEYYDPLSHCANLTEIVVEEGNPYLTVVDNVLFNKDKTVLLAYPKGSKATSYSVPHGVTEIGSNAFSETTALQSVSLPESITKIGYFAFAGCDGLREIGFSEGLTTIGTSAFLGCRTLEEIVLPDSLSSLENCAFSGCQKLTSVFIPAGLTKIEESTFADCPSLIEFKTATDSESFCAMDGILFNKDRTVLVRFPEGMPGNIYHVPEGVKEIADSAFEGCRNLPYVFLPETLLRIGDGAFLNCESLRGVTIPDSVQRIETAAFEDCRMLTEVIIGKGVTYIDTEAFYNNPKLKTVTLSANVKEIGSNAIGFCHGEIGYGSHLPGFTLRCEENTAAQAYAEKNDVPFEILSDES